MSADGTSLIGDFSDGIDDVEEFVCANEGEASISYDRFRQVFEFVQNGNRAFRRGRFEEAINCYSKANVMKPYDPIILSNRCAAYIRLSHFLKSRPSSASECSPLYGLDPTTHAELALKDAQKVTSLKNNSLKSCILHADALFLLERYDLARDIIFSGLQLDPLSVTLNNIIQKNFPEEYAERKSENDSLTKLSVDLIPLFVMDAVLPCEKLPLNIFEPRYRLMVRRIMEGNHRMGMVILDSTTGHLADFACEVEITECEPLPDGRFYIEVEGRRRFRILQSWDQDGYRVAEVEWVRDIQPPEGTKERTDLQELTSNAAEYAQLWMIRAKEAARQDRRRLAELLAVETMMPSQDDPERFSFWLMTLSKRRPSERLELLRLRDTKERITRGLIYLRQEEQGCRLQ